jgi:CubicO group peptidase (beta-lactamase class C family)
MTGKLYRACAASAFAAAMIGGVAGAEAPAYEYGKGGAVSASRTATRRASDAVAEPEGRSPSEEFDAVVAGYRASLKKSGIAGSSLTIVRDGRTVLADAEGLQSVERREPVTPDTIFHWASITKTFTGIAIMQLRDRGLLSLDDPVVKYVPELRLAHDPFGDIAQVKIRHLMSHSAGFRGSTWPWGGDKPWHPFEPTTWDQLVAMLPYTDVQFAPGTKYSYSNPGVIFLGRIIEQLSGDDYEVYVTKNILMPLGMHSTFFDRAPYYLLPRRSHSYFRDDEGLHEARFDFDTGITVSNGGLNAPLTDMAKYLSFLLGTDGTPETAVLKRSSLEDMWTPQIRATEGEGVNGAESSAALSFFVEKWPNAELVGHSGDQNGFISHLYLHRPSRTGWVISMNTDTTAAKDGSRPSSREVDMEVRKLILEHVIK